jgi:tRNA A-37 threonylcarbamoyl transferase component Bud32
MSCVGDNTLVQFVEGRLGGAMRSQVENHLAGCGSCRALVSELGKSSVVPEPASPAEPSLFPVGTHIGQRYEVTRFIAAGGMGEVYEAVDRELGARIALKTMRPEVAKDPRALDRFKREIHLARKVTHPNVCRIFDFGVHEGTVPFLTMELLDGPTLAQHLKRVGRLAPTDAAPLVDQLTAALEAAHQAGVVHRDFKPQNVVLLDMPRGGWKAVVTDFGVARASDGDDLAVTHTGARGLVGSPAYMAPEQVEGRPAGPAADLFSLGVVMFEMVTGALPFEGDTPLMTALMRLEKAPPPPRSLAGDLDERWERTILKCLAREAADRPSSAREVFLAIASAGRAIAPTVMPMAGLQAPEVHAAPPPPRWPFFVAAVAIVLASTAVIVTKLKGPAHTAQAAPIEQPRTPPPPPEKPPEKPPERASVILRSEPAGAIILVDEQAVATTPAIVQLALPHDVTVQLDGYRPQTQRVESAGELTVRLSPLRPKARPAPRPQKRLLDE